MTPGYYIYMLAQGHGIDIQVTNKVRPGEFEYRYDRVNGWRTILASVSAYGLLTKSEKEAERFTQCIAHELGHFAVASEERRKKNNYGIPGGERGTGRKWGLDEAKAIVVEGAILRWADANVPKDPIQYKEGAWIDYRKEVLKWWREVGKERTADFLKTGWVR